MKLEIQKTSCRSGHHTSWQNPTLPAVTYATAQESNHSYKSLHLHLPTATSSISDGRSPAVSLLLVCAQFSPAESKDVPAKRADLVACTEQKAPKHKKIGNLRTAFTSFSLAPGDRKFRDTEDSWGQWQIPLSPGLIP